MVSEELTKYRYEILLLPSGPAVRLKIAYPSFGKEMNYLFKDSRNIHGMQ